MFLCSAVSDFFENADVFQVFFSASFFLNGDKIVKSNNGDICSVDDCNGFPLTTSMEIKSLHHPWQKIKRVAFRLETEE